MPEWLFRATVWAIAGVFFGIGAVCLTMFTVFWFRAASLVDKRRGQPADEFILFLVRRHLSFKARTYRSDLNSPEEMAATETNPAEKQRLLRALNRMRSGIRLLALGGILIAGSVLLHMYLTMWS